MTCYHPVVREIKSANKKWHERWLALACGQCIGCRLARSRAWALRCMHEAQMHRESSFVTLTYDDENYTPTLVYSDFQRFMYRVREYYGPTRFFMGGEYGSEAFRPHYHAILFGRGFDRGSQVSDQAFDSRELRRCWTKGFSSTGSVTFESAQYVAKYCHKKVTGPLADAHYLTVDRSTGEFVYVEPEFGHMSLRPGIGYSWFQKFWKDIYGARDGVPLQSGRECPSPRFYDRLLLQIDPLKHEAIHAARDEKFRFGAGGASLLSQEMVAHARLKFYSKEKL